MANDKDFQEQIKRLGKLIAQFEQLPEGPQKTTGKELVQLLMDVHGAGLERILEIVFDSKTAGPAVIDELGRDTVAGNMLLLYSLHPDDLETRIHRAVDRLRPQLRKLSCSVEVVSMDNGAVKVKLSTTGHSCGSSLKEMKSVVEEGVYEYAPDVTSLEILGVEEPTPTGFVSLESVLRTGMVTTVPNGHSLQAKGAH